MDSPTVRCIAIDDEPLALEIIDKFCQRTGGVELLTFSDPSEGLDAILSARPQIVFLDIEMDSISGLDIAARLPADTCVIFTTAYPNYAVEGFNLDAVDYLQKPFAYKRFETAFAKALRRISANRMTAPAAHIVVKQEYTNVSIPLDDIVYIEAMEGYSKIFRASGKCIISRVLLKNILAMLPKSFVRIHRSFVVSRARIKSFTRQEVTMCDSTVLPVGRQYSAVITSLLDN